MTGWCKYRSIAPRATRETSLNLPLVVGMLLEVATTIGALSGPVLAATKKMGRAGSATRTNAPTIRRFS